MNYKVVQAKDDDRLRKHRQQTLCRKQPRISAVIIASLLVICSLSLLFYSTVSSASVEPLSEKRFESIEIQPGDSLWSIATDYYTEEWGSIDNYIEEIKKFNGIYYEDIRFGDYLMIPYYAM